MLSRDVCVSNHACTRHFRHSNFRALEHNSLIRKRFKNPYTFSINPTLNLPDTQFPTTVFKFFILVQTPEQRALLINKSLLINKIKPSLLTFKETPVVLILFQLSLCSDTLSVCVFFSYLDYLIVF